MKTVMKRVENIHKKDLIATDKKVGARLRIRRIALGMSQEKVALELDITFQQLQKYENGANRIGASRLLHICQVLGVEPNYFFQECKYTESLNGMPDYTAQFLSTREGVDIAKYISLLPEKRRRPLARIIANVVAAMVEHVVIAEGEQ
jgi:transcriptional regulator with XRE-family HTH domain